MQESQQRSQIAIPRAKDARRPTTIDDSSDGPITFVELRDDNDGTAVRVLVGRRIGRYELIRRQRSDGIGSLWQAQYRERPMLLRVVRHSQWKDRTRENQWLLAAMRGARLRHRGIAPIREVACLKKCTLVATDWVPGRTLNKALAKSDFTIRHAVTLIAAVTEALDYAHSRGLVHGDLTPNRVTLKPVPARSRRVRLGNEESSAGSANSPISGATSLTDAGYCQRAFDEQPVVTGFGATSCDSNPIRSGRRSNSKQLAYASPERVQGEAALDDRMDIYSVGVMLYELLTGELPFRGVPEVIIPRILHESPMSLQRLNPAVDPELERIVLRCLTKQPNARYSAGELAKELRAWLDGERTTQFRASMQRRRPIAALAVSVFFAASLLGWPLTARLRTGLAASSIPGQTKTVVEPTETIDSAKRPDNQTTLAVATSDSSTEKLRHPYDSPDSLPPAEEPVSLPPDPSNTSTDGSHDDITSGPTGEEARDHLAFTRLYQTARRARAVETVDRALEANRAAREALEAAIGHESAAGDIRGFLAATCLDAALLQHRAGHLAEGESNLQRARSALEGWPDRERSGDRGRWLGALYFELAQLEMRFRHVDSAIVTYQKSLAIRGALVKDDSKDVRVREDLAESYCGLALQLARLNRTAESREYLEQARRSLEQLAMSGLETPNHLRDWARFWNNVGCTEFVLGDHQSASESFERAQKLFEHESSWNDETIELIAQCYTNCGIAQRAAGEHDAAKRSFDRAFEVRSQH